MAPTWIKVLRKHLKAWALETLETISFWSERSYHSFITFLIFKYTLIPSVLGNWGRKKYLKWRRQGPKVLTFYDRVEYGRKCVIHRWDEEVGTPRRRRPTIYSYFLLDSTITTGRGGRLSLSLTGSFWDIKNSVRKGNDFENGDNMHDDHHEKDHKGEESFIL